MTSMTFTPERTKQDRTGHKLPPLIHGDHLTRAEFERRYAAQPQIKKAELVEGVVYMPSPVHLDKHSKPHSRIVLLLGSYVAATPGTDFGDNATLRLDRDNEVQPDAFLRLRAAVGGLSWVGEDDFLEGAPELIVEVAGSSAAYDLHEKLHVYRRNGVQEYLILLAYEQETRWFELVEGEYKPLLPNEDDIFRSRVFPGLHFHSDLFWDDNLSGLLQILQAGIATTEHQAFVAALQARQASE